MSSEEEENCSGSGSEAGDSGSGSGSGSGTASGESGSDGGDSGNDSVKPKRKKEKKQTSVKSDDNSVTDSNNDEEGDGADTDGSSESSHKASSKAKKGKKEKKKKKKGGKSESDDDDDNEDDDDDEGEEEEENVEDEEEEGDEEDDDNKGDTLENDDGEEEDNSDDETKDENSKTQPPSKRKNTLDKRQKKQSVSEVESESDDNDSNADKVSSASKTTGNSTERESAPGEDTEENDSDTETARAEEEEEEEEENTQDEMKEEEEEEEETGADDKEEEETGADDKEEEETGTDDKEEEENGTDDKEEEENGTDDKEEEENGTDSASESTARGSAETDHTGGELDEGSADHTCENESHSEAASRKSTPRSGDLTQSGNKHSKKKRTGKQKYQDTASSRSFSRSGKSGKSQSRNGFASSHSPSESGNHNDFPSEVVSEEQNEQGVGEKENNMGSVDDQDAELRSLASSVQDTWESNGAHKPNTATESESMGKVNRAAVKQTDNSGADRSEKKSKGKSKTAGCSPGGISETRKPRQDREVSSAPARSSGITPQKRSSQKNRKEKRSSSEVASDVLSTKSAGSSTTNQTSTSQADGTTEDGTTNASASPSSSELSDESYILQKFSSSEESEGERGGGRGGSRTYPLPVQRPHRALLESSFTSLYDLRTGGVFRAAEECEDDDGTSNENHPVLAEENRLQDELMRTTQLVYSCESGRMVPKLREPRNLYALAKELGPQQAARWPSEIEVQRGRVHHMYHVPSEPEPFYKMTGTEKTPMCRGEENGGKVVFQYDPKFSFFMRSRVGGSRNSCSKCSVDLESDKDKTLLFESRFESGNLAKAIKVGEHDYELWQRYDLYTSKHTQWFYFRVTNMKPNVVYRFTIVNFLKPDSLYNYGMQPCMYSDKEAAQNKVGWIRAGQNIKYYRNNLKYETSKGDRSFYSLTWTMQFPHENDTVYLAHCYPYTYSDLQDYLLELQNDPIKSRICKQRVLCRTLAGNLVYVLTITSSSQTPEDMKHKKAVVLTSRVHPGECNASWMMKGFLDYLTGNSADAKLLRDTFIFKIVPMLNPDGVIVGNYRCSLAGRDLNRNYKTVLKDSYPSVWHTKNMIRKLLQERDIIMYCDLHGHSRRQNVFIYGCEQRLNSTKRLHERIFPCMLQKNAPDKFSFDACKFKVQKSKEGTGRIVMWNMGIMNSFTMEATFCGSSLGKKKGFHFTVADYEALGYHFCDTLLDYCDPDNSKYANILGNLENRMKMEILARFGQDPSNATDINLSDYASDMESSDGGSDSSVSDGPPVHLQYNLERPLKKKKKLKTRKDRDRVRQAGAPEDPKKPNTGTQTEEKQGRAEGGAGKADKVGTGQTSSGKPQDKVAPLPFRYSSNAGKRPRSNDNRSNNGVPIFVQERYEERQQKRDYLQALTTAYLRNGIPLNKDPGGSVSSKPLASAMPEMHSVVNFRYSERTPVGGGGTGGGGGGGGTGDGANLPFNLEGLCAHHGQTLAAQMAAAGHSSRPQPGPGAGYPPSSYYPGQQQEQQQRHRQLHQSRAREDAHRKQERLHQMAPQWRQDSSLRLTPLSHNPTAPVPDGNNSHSGAGGEGPSGGVRVEEYVRSQITPSSSITPLDRRIPSRPHLLEVSAAQQRQQDTLRETSSARGATGTGTSRQPVDSKGETGSVLISSSNASSRRSSSSREGELEDGSRVHHGGKSHLRTRVPSATAVSYRSPGDSVILTQPVSLLGQTAGDAHHQSGDKGLAGTSRRSWERSHDGRKSRKGMREGEEEEMDSGPTPRAVLELGEGGGGGSLHRAPRVKSAHTSQDMVEAMDSIRQLQNSLHSGNGGGGGGGKATTTSSNLTSATGTYIKQLIRETNDEIKDLTNEIEDEIEHKLQEVRQLQQGAVSARPDLAGPAVGSKKASGGNGSMMDFQQQTATQGEASGHQTSRSENDGQGLREMSGAVPMDLGDRGMEGSFEGRAKDRSGSLSYLPSEERKRVGSAVQTSGGREEYVHVTTADGVGEMVPRARSARSCRQVVETVPTKISLMICSDHKDGGDGPGKKQFLPLYRSVRAPFFRNYTQPRRK